VGPELINQLENSRVAPNGRNVPHAETTTSSGPTYKDADDDRLPDRFERNNRTNDGVSLPGADPMHKDLYLRVYVAKGIELLSEKELASLKQIWTSMPISNPNNRSGIDLHVTQIRLDRRIERNISDISLPNGFYDNNVPERAQCIVHAVVFIDVSETRRGDGLASTPGYLAMVDGTNPGSENVKYTRRVGVMTHELLHNVVGHFEDGSAHVSGGWLKAETSVGSDYYMNDRTASHLSEDGFDDSKYYQKAIC
ncbi:MAG: hypothetical protein ABEI52_02330, partial [Halobacteriaceae archaeon]